MNNLGHYHDLYVQSDILLLADVFENFGNTCIETYKLDPAYFLSAPTLTWQPCSIKYYAIIIHAEANNKYIRIIYMQFMQ